jgi:ABC-2 type transport system ATP-binding protein
LGPVPALRAVPGVVEATQPAADRYELRATADLRGEAAEAVVKAGGRLLSLAVETPSLDDIYARYFQEAGHAGTN